MNCRPPTTSPIAQGSGEDPIFDVATLLGDSRFSQGAWTLAAGSYTVTGLATASPFDGGIGYLSVAAVPEPETYALFLAGLALVGAVARRRATGV